MGLHSSQPHIELEMAFQLICVCVCPVKVMVCVLKSGYNLKGSILPFHHIGPRDQIYVLRLGSKDLYPSSLENFMSKTV